MTGRHVGIYEIFEKLGEGGMGSVYRAVDTMVNRQAAIKVLRAELSQNAEVLGRFRAEASTLARLNHPNIALLYSFFREGEEYFMAMEFVPGRTLSSMLKTQGALPWPRAIEMTLGVLEALKHAHQLGIQHRDIKPANIMVTGDGTVKVTDFGIARAIGGERLTREGRLVGTLEYLAPERALGRESDHRSDLYSAGVVLYEMLTGRLPFEAQSDYELLKAQVEATPPSLEQLGVAVPPALAEVLVVSLAKNPDARYPNAEAMAAVLRSAMVAGPRPTTLATPISAPTRLAQAPYPNPTVQAQQWTPQTQWSQPVPAQSRAPLFVAIGLGLLVFLSAGGYAAYRLLKPKPVVVAEVPANPGTVPKTRENPIVRDLPVGPPETPPPSNPQQPPGESPKSQPTSPKSTPSQPALREEPKEEPKGDAPKEAPKVPARRALSSIRQARSIYIERAEEAFDLLFRAEITAQLSGRMTITAYPGRADTIMRIRIDYDDQGKGVAGGAGRAVGLRGRKEATVRIYDTASGRMLWEEHDNDRRGMGGITGGGDRKLAERIVGKLRKLIE